MKIAFINIYQNKVKRGSETFIDELAKKLSVGHEVKIFTKLDLRNLFGKFDIIVPTNGRLQVFLIRLLCWACGSKMVVSGHSGIGLDDRLNLYAFPDHFVALSSKALNWAKKTNPLVRSTYIPNGVDLEKFKSGKFKLKNVVLAVGAFTREKRHELTINAVAKLDDVKLIIAGGGGGRKSETYELGRRVLGKDRFTILSVENEKMPGIYKEASVLAFPTVPWESFGIVLLEAMASGLPVVANDDPIRREIVGDAGVFIDPTDTEAYAAALKKALSDNWNEKPRKQAEKFDWDKIAKRYEELFKSLI